MLLTASLLGCTAASSLEGGSLDDLEAPSTTAEPLPDTVEPARQPAAAPSILVSAVGDCTLGSTHNTFARELSKHDDELRYPFSGVREILAGDDLTIANLETPLTTRPRRKGVLAPFRGKPEWAAMLRYGSVEVVSTANNHTSDCGGFGAQDTLEALDQAGVGAFGGELIHRTTVQGVEIVNIGYTGGQVEILDRVQRRVTDHKRADNLVIVSFHWGGEYMPTPTPTQYRLGRGTIDAGADLVLGHHPHVLQGIELYRGKRIVYSLANFVFGGDSDPDDKDSIIYQARFEPRDGTLVQTDERIIPVSVSSNAHYNDYRPRPLEGLEAARVTAKMNDRTAALAPFHP